MIDDREETAIILAHIVVAMGIFVLICIFMTGCAGTAKYAIEKGDTKLTVYNTKDVGELKAEALYNPETGEFLITLDEKSVSASGPQAQQNELFKMLIPLVKTPLVK